MEDVVLYGKGVSYTVTSFGICETSTSLPMNASDPFGWTSAAHRVSDSTLHDGVVCTEWLAQEPSPYSPLPINKTIWIEKATGVPKNSIQVFPHTGPGTPATLTVNESWSHWVSGPQPPAALAVPEACK
jgi:hypothetical protein